MISGRRRDFLKGGGLAVGVLATGSCAVSGAAATPSQIQQVASFGWEVTNLAGNGANMYSRVPNNMVLNAVDVDISAMILASNAAGFAEVLCVGGVSRQAVPTFNNSAEHAFVNFPASSDFGPVIAENPNNLNLVFDGALFQDQFLAVILKTWVPTDGTASATSRHVTAYPSLPLNAGDYLVFHMDHGGVGVDAEMQVVINYTKT